MIKNKILIEETIELMKKENDPVQSFATRNKDSPKNIWSKFIPFSRKEFNKIYNSNIDGLKLRFKFTTLFINGRHKNN